MRGIQYAAASRFHHPRSGILDHPLSRMMTTDVSDRIQIQTAAFLAGTVPRSRRAMRPSFALTSALLKTEGAVLPQEGSRECRMLGASAAACAVVVSTRVS